MAFKRKLSLRLLLYIIAIAAESTLSLTSTETKISTLRQIIVSNETIYVGGVGGIVSYHRENMTIKSIATKFSNVWLLLYDEENEEIIQCNQNNINISQCSKLNINLQMTGIESSNMSVDIRYLPTYSMIYVNEINTSIVVIGANSAEVQTTSYGVLSFNLTDFTLFNTTSFRKGSMNIERAEKEKITLAFKSSFYHAQHVYFFFRVHVHNKSESSRIGKLCLNYKNNYNKSGYYHSYEDMNITCKHNEMNLTAIENVIDEGVNLSYFFSFKTTRVSSVRLQLVCGTSANEDGEYFKPDIERGTSENCFENKTYCNKATKLCRELEGDFCDMKHYHTLVSGKGIDNMDNVYDIDKTITAMDILQTSNYSVLYFGTVDGLLGRVYLQLGGEHGNLTTKFVSVANSTIINIKVEQNSVYFITEKKDTTIIMFQTFPRRPVDGNANVTCRITRSEGGGNDNVTDRDRKQGNVSISTNGSSFCKIDVQNLTTGQYTFEIMYKEVIMGNATIEFYKCQDLEILETCRKYYDCCESLDPLKIEIFPLSGPINGGTLITVFTNSTMNIENATISIAEVNCEVKETANNSVSCITGERMIHILHTRIQRSTTFFPRKGITSGNTTITITGQNITFEGPNRYNISLCENDSCITCRFFQNELYKLDLQDSTIMCKTGNSTGPINLTELVVFIDTNTHFTLNGTFQYLPDPTFEFVNETLNALESGGAKFTINGNGFNNVGQITVERVVEPCKVPSDNQALCQIPEKVPDQPNNQTVIVNFDGIARAFEINYVDDPSFERFDGVVDYNKESPITIKGKNILNGARFVDYKIQVGLDGKCLISKISMEFIICVPPKNVPRTNKSEVNTVHVIVEVGRIAVYIGDIQYQEDVKVLAIIAEKKRKAIKEFKMELMTREEMVRKASREEFADAQMTMKSIKSDLFTSKVPFCDYKTYVLRQLFPNQDITTNPLLHGLKISDEKKDVTETAIDNFKMLLSNKLFLKSLVQTIDRPSMLTIQEKAHFSSVLSISLIGNMTLFFDLIECLMVDIIRSANKKQQKVLFRRFESITLRLMANWLQIGLYGQLTSNCGMQLFMLYKAVKTIVEMAPIDALTSNSKNTIAEEKLLKMRIEHQSFTLQIDLNGNSDKRYPVKVLDCDTISQVKQKCCEQIYKNNPSSKIPHNDELSLGKMARRRAGKLTLADIDNTNERKNGLLCLNTLNHYMVKDNSRMALIYKQRENHTVNVNSTAFQAESLMSEDITLLMPENAECSELEVEKCHLSDLPDGQSNTDADFGDIFLNRLFLTKLLLSDCIDTTFASLIDPQSLSIPIRYFIGVLDRLGKTYGVEQDVLQSWKNECYATRVWAPLIGKTDILFDVSVPAYVEPCMDILRQVFVESFTQTAHKVNKESPPHKLLFHKDIPRYRKLIGPFFIRLEPVTDKEFESEMDEISDVSTKLLTEPNPIVAPHHIDSGLCLEPHLEDATCNAHCMYLSVDLLGIVKEDSHVKGDAVEFSGTDNFQSVDKPLYALPKEPASPANITLTFKKTPTKYNYQKFLLANKGFIPANKPNGFFTHVGCEWKRPTAIAFHYYVHTHVHGIFAEGFLIRNNTWTYLGGQKTRERKKASRCLFINNEDKAIDLKSEDACIFQLSVGYDIQYHEYFARQPGCISNSPDFTFCSNDKTAALCDR
ncbi:PLXNA [Mytilus edulis]|uniref:PLXNA n=1 Tax=Mytilus edulis TaxID=6550 RepID=A0A8S3RFN2_MYTED|nr:PLXNA [Mytilus edulis]